MKIGIIGAGFTGLAAAYYLGKSGHKVTILDMGEKPGGLAIGYKEKEWDWTLEEHYHHWFTNDFSVLDLAKEIGYEVVIRRPKTSNFVESGIYQLDSPTSLLKFPDLSILDRLRMGASLAFLRYNPIWKPFEYFKAEPYLKLSMGKKGYEKLWKPLMVNKLGDYSKDVSLAWFWSRVYKRTPSLAYPKGGFLKFAKELEKVIEKQGGKFIYDAQVVDLVSNKKVTITYQKKGKKNPNTLEFDKVVVTSTIPVFAKIAKDLPESYINKYTKLNGIGAINLVVRFKKPFFSDGTYWLSMSEIKSPILAIVEHTNFMESKNYNNEHIVYFGNYMPATDPRFNMNEKQILKLYKPWLKKINRDFEANIISMKIFKAFFAQPIITTNHSKKIPGMITPLKNVYLSNIQQVYPWDRGTNYAVELGKKVSELILS
ncbi:MAG TPA: FAD-dependent oxidoreductase [Patescibacteria group bacterium]|nr:FAD-dependent oxidoreductase [Patescibacteria group bacterium]